MPFARPSDEVLSSCMMTLDILMEIRRQSEEAQLIQSVFPDDTCVGIEMEHWLRIFL